MNEKQRHEKSEPHIHIYDAQGKQICCSLEEKINQNIKIAGHIDHAHTQIHGNEGWRQWWPIVTSSALLFMGILFDKVFTFPMFSEKSVLRFAWYLAAYLPVGIPVIRDAVKSIFKRDVFSEFLLMSIATIGAFAIREYPEGVAVMLFYAVGELFQTAAVRRAKKSIQALLDVRPDKATVSRDGAYVDVKPETVQPGEVIRLRPGERVPLDGVLIAEKSLFDTSALTGESKGRVIESGGKVLAGMINLESVISINVSKLFGESSLSRILEMVQNATSRKAPTELFIRKFARIYTPIVVGCAAILTLAPYFIVTDYSLATWLYRSLIFLVIACPCALVISIPLGYFGGIGAASRQGVLFKGSNYLDAMTKVTSVVMDKTGTLTKGVFKVQTIQSHELAPDRLLNLVAALEQTSTHPIASAIRLEATKKGNAFEKIVVTNVKEISGLGLSGVVDGKNILAGNAQLLKKFRVPYPEEISTQVETVVVVSVENKYAGYIVISDEIKPDAIETVIKLREAGIQELIMLSGDKDAVVQRVITKLGIEKGYGDLLPEEKVQKLQALKIEKPGRTIAFVGDGINDAPVLAAADVGIAMGGLGSDVAIETADIVIQTDEPSKIATAVAISKATKRVVWQNIILAFGVKGLVLLLGAGGLATMWEAVFADVGVALLAIGNAYRIQK